jgi:hypothetical protein
VDEAVITEKIAKSTEVADGATVDISATEE